MAGTLAADEGRSRKKGDDEQGELDPAALRKLLDALSAAADGDFSQRLPARRKGLLGELEARVQPPGRALAGPDRRVRPRRAPDRSRGPDDRARPARGRRPRATTASASTTVNGLIDDLVRPTTEVARVIVAVAEGDLTQSMAMEIDGQPVKGEFARIGTTVNAMVDQLSSFADEVTRVAREVGTDGKLGGQAEVPGVSRHVGRPHRVGQLDGREPDGPGPQHRPGHHRGRPGRPDPEDHRRRPRRDPRAQGHHQHDGRPARLVRRRGHARGARGRHRRQARRPGRGARRLRHVARPDRERQLHGAQPDRPGARHRPGRRRGRQGRPDPEDHRRRQGRGRGARRHDQRDDRHAVGLRRAGHARGARGRHRGQARRPGRGAGRVRAPGRTSPSR